jgi:hypothetical protein
LKTDKRYTKTILTVNGKLEFSRYMLRPADRESLQLLAISDGTKAVSPMDDFLGIAKLPFKMTAQTMLLVAYWAQNQCSYQRAEEAIEIAHGIFVNDDTVRLVTNYIGGMIFKEDCRKADECEERFFSGKISFPRNKKGTLYVETDGAALNTRQTNGEGSTWRENKLAMVFSSDNIREWTDRHGKRQRKLGKREYTSYIGSVSDFRKHLLACAVRNGYGAYEDTVVLSDGAAWIRKTVAEFFPDAQHILDFFHLSENVHEYAKHYFRMDESKYKPWAEDICALLREGRHIEVSRELKTHSKSHMDKCPVSLSLYIANNIQNIDYPTYEAKGWYIGSGAIESGNKIVMQQRLKQAGMRWNIDTAQCLLTLKAKFESGLWRSDVENFILSVFN